MTSSNPTVMKRATFIPRMKDNMSAKVYSQFFGCWLRMLGCKERNPTYVIASFMATLLFGKMARQGLGKILIGIGFFAWLLHAAAAFAGSPFYLTVERGFSTSEAPVIRLDYTVTDQPMLLRVLKPERLDSFLDGQFNISRSYEQPQSQLNPGYYFVNGLNAAKSPLRLLRGMLSVDFRKSLHDTAFSKAVVNVGNKPLAAAPQQILTAPPAGFQVVRENFLDLQHNGADTHDLGWWFGQDAWSEMRYKVRELTLEPLADGVYLLQAVQGKTEAQCLIQVSSLAVQIKQSSGQLLARVMNRDLRPVANVKIGYRDARGLWQTLPGATGDNGELAFKNPEGVLDGKLLVKAEAPALKAGESTRVALISTDFLPSQSRDDAVFVLTDRPIFKPGETFYYKGMVRTMQDGRLQIPAFQSPRADVSLIRADGGATGLQGVTKLTDFGSFSGSFDLDAAQTPGLYRLLAQIDEKTYGGEFRVRDYVKPTFYLELLERSPSVAPGQTFSVKFRAKRYSGGVPQDVKFEVFLYRKKFEAPQFVMESGAGLTAGNDYFGQVKSAAPLTQPQRLYSSIEARQAAELGNPWESAAKLGENGEGAFEFTVPAGDTGKQEQEWIYTLMVRAQDPSGGMAILADNIYATLSAAQPAIRFNKTVAAAGEADVQIVLQSSYADGKPAGKAGGVIDVMLEQPGSGKRDLVKLPFGSDENGQQRLTLPALQGSGRLTAIARLESLDGRKLTHPASSQPATLIVAGAAGEAVADNPELELYTPSTILSPGERAKVFALLPKDWGAGETGPVWETVSGEGIFESRGARFKGRSAWFEVTAKPEYGTGFYHTVTVPAAGGKFKEQTLGFRIVPKDKRLQIAILPEKAETEPLKTARIRLEVKQADGAPAADTELAVSIVDRAVYAVQAEFRPGVFDFFYPLQRNNLATFYSDELQGYGYADLLRKPNFALSALKSQTKLVKKAMRDTAGWFPHVVTDANGEASIDVEMPANITEWLVTAVGGDKQGRLGENTGQFRTVTDVAAELAGPQFLRVGDEAEMSIQLGNHLPRPVTVAGQIDLPAALQLQSGELTAKMPLAANQETLWPLRLRAAGPPGAAALRLALTVDSPVRVGGAEEFDLPIKSAAFPRVLTSTWQDNLLRTELPAQALPLRVDIRVNSGLLGAALQAAAMLVQYPYGCTEQLAHGVAPNLVLMDLVERAGLKPEQLGPLAAPLQRARQNAVLGIRKLLGNQKADGGFSLWPGDSEASAPVTLIAMQALKYAEQLKVAGAAAPLYKAQEWLALQKTDGGKDDGFVLSAFGEFNIYPGPWQEQAEFVRQIAANKNAGANSLINALRILLKYQNQKWHNFNKQIKVSLAIRQDIIRRLQLALDAVNPADYGPYRGNGFRNTMGFDAGLPSMLSAGLGVLEEAHALPAALESKLKVMLLQNQKNGYWGSTYDTAQVIYNTRNLLSREAEQVRDKKNQSRSMTATAKNGYTLGGLTAIPGGYIGGFTQFGEQPDISEIGLSSLNADEIASANVSIEQPYPAVTAGANGLSIERDFRRITAKGADLFDPGQTLKVGDLLISEVRVKRDPVNGRDASRSEFVVIEDGVPSIAVGLENDRTYLADAKIQPKEDSYWSGVKETQLFPDRIVRIVKLSAGAETRLYQVWRITRPGAAAIPPAAALDMYNAATQGNTPAAAINAAR